MKKYIGIFLMLLFLPLVKVKGICNNSQIVNMNKLAKNVTSSYEYYKEGDTIKFKVTLTNLDRSLLIYDGIKRKEYTNKSGEMTISGYEPGTTIRYLIFAKDTSCTDQTLATIYVNLPFYNPYYNDKLCEQVPDYKYCQKWVKMPFKYEKFKQNLEIEIKSREAKKQSEKEPIKEDYSIFSIIYSWYIQYYYIFLPLVILICALEMYHLNKKNQLFIK